MKLRNYKIWVLILRGIVLAIPVSILAISTWVENLSEDLCDWLNVNLPNPRKREK